MIALLSGKIAYKTPDHVIIDVNGVGYRVTIPFSTYYELPEEGIVSLHIHTSVREDAIMLYGFRTRTEKTFFQLLISVSGIGPKLARDILSNIDTFHLADALAQGSIHKLSAIPGIGKKTAERLVLELKDKVGKLDATKSAPKGEEAVAQAGHLEDVASALMNLGYREQIVRKAVSSLDASSGEGVEELLRQALRILMK